jgi:hypothetical protein
MEIRVNIFLKFVVTGSPVSDNVRFFTEEAFDKMFQNSAVKE